MVRLTKKTVSFLLVILMLFTSSTFASADELDEVVYAAMEHIFKHEGNYDSILADDNGAVSLGKIAWHGPRALQLIKMIEQANPEQAKQILGEELYIEITQSELKDWNYRCFSKEETELFKQLLATDESKAAQDKLAFEDVRDYIIKAQSMGIKDGKVLVYFADLQNQMGSGGVTRVAEAAIAAAGGAEKVTIEDIYNAAMADSVASSSPTRRRQTYEYCLSLEFGKIEINHNFKLGEYKITASSLRVRSGPGTDYETVAQNLLQDTVVTVLKIDGDWGQIAVNGKTGWINLLYAVSLENEKEDPADINSEHDINGNGKTDAADARLALRAAAKLQTLTEEQKKAADCDGDGNVTAADARRILRVAAKLQ